MPVTPTFPGIYIEELPSNSHTITAAPTSIAVFIGYSHPFRTRTFGVPKELFSFTDYETWFGGFFQADAFANDDHNFADLAQAVNQFFLNGGTDAYVVGLQATVNGTLLQAPALTLGPIAFSALQVTDPHHVLHVRLDYPPGASMSASVSQPDPPVDVTITYGPPAAGSVPAPGTTVEVYRRVSLYTATIAGQRNPNYILNRINGSSGLVVAALASVPSSLTEDSFAASIPAGVTVFQAGDFTKVFEADQPLDKVPIFNLLVLPGVTSPAVLSAATAFCEGKRAFFIMDPPLDDSADGSDPRWPHTIQDTFNSGSITKDKNSALYFPYLQSNDPQTGAPVELPPSPTVAGIFARTDTDRGVWKAPAGLETTLVNVTNVVERGKMTDMRQGVLNQLGVNCIRAFPGIGTVVWGARTSQAANPAFQQWKYVPVRRMALFLEQTLYANLGWVVFEPNDEPLWAAIRGSIEAFMLGLFRQGAFQGTTASEAFQVKCDAQTTTQADIDNGIVNIVVAFAPLKPAECVIIKIAQLAGQAQAS
jgi:uncharacterized protein